MTETEFTGDPLLVVIVTLSIAWGVWEWYTGDRGRTPEQIMLARQKDDEREQLKLQREKSRKQTEAFEKTSEYRQLVAQRRSAQKRKRAADRKGTTDPKG